MKLYQKPSGLWAVEFYDENGKRVRLSTGHRDQAKARVEARRLVGAPSSETRAGGHRSTTTEAAKSGTFRELFRRCAREVWRTDQVRSQATLQSNLRVLEAIRLPGQVVPLGDLPVATLEDKAALADVQSQLFAAGYKPATVKRKMETLSKALTMAVEWGLIIRKPKRPTIRINNFRERELSAAEEAHLFDVVLPGLVENQPTGDWIRFTAMVRWALNTGCRLTEITEARRSWIRAATDRDGNPYMRLDIPSWVAKSGKARAVPLRQSSVADLHMLTTLGVPAKANPRAPADEAGQVLLFPFKPANVWYRWNTVKARMADGGFPIDDLVFHGLRHTCLSRLARRAPIQLVSKWAGHSDIQTTMTRYAHLGVEDLAMVAELGQAA